MKLLYRIGELLFPGKCVLCGRKLQRGELDLCGDCREIPGYSQRKLNFQFLDSFAAVWYYEGYVRKSLLRYKFRNQRSYAAAYGRAVAMMLLREYPEGFDLITWVPVSRLRKLRRGYDQVELLAKAVCSELGTTPCRCLKKIRHNPPQYPELCGATGQCAGCLYRDGTGSDPGQADPSAGRYRHHRCHRGRMRPGAADSRGCAGTLCRRGGFP